MDRAYESQFEDLNFQTPCGHQTFLNDLTYNWPAGFAKFMISIEDPERDLNKDTLTQLDQIFGTKMRIVKAHY